MLVDRLVASGIGVVIGAGNDGPKPGSAYESGAVVVAAASRDGLQFYSSRGTPATPRVSWADLVDDLKPGEKIAAGPTPVKVLGTGAALSAPRRSFRNSRGCSLTA